MSEAGQHVFISYKTEERDIAQNVRANLALALKCDVWWDQDLQTGGQWSVDLDEAVRKAASVVVLWSRKSCASPWVQQEAAVAKTLGTLSPAKIEDCEIPAPYRGVQAARLQNWDFTETHPEFVKLATRVRQCLEESSVEESPAAEPEASPAELHGRSLKWWLTQFSPGQLWSLFALAVSFTIIAFNVGAWTASLNLPYLRDLPWFPTAQVGPVTQFPPASTPDTPPASAFDAVSDFSASDNPSGSWHYGFFQSGNTEFNRFVDHAVAQGLVSWRSGDQQPSLGLNQTSEPIVRGANDYVSPVKMIWMHPGPGGERSVLRWISPHAGTFRVVGRFEGLNKSAGTSSSGSIYQGADRVLFDRQIRGYGPESTQHFDLDIQVSSGEAIDFAVGFGANGNYNSDSTGLYVEIISGR